MRCLQWIFRILFGGEGGGVRKNPGGRKSVFVCRYIFSDLAKKRVCGKRKKEVFLVKIKKRSYHICRLG